MRNNVILLHQNMPDCPVHTLETGNRRMDNTRLVITETFVSDTEQERKENLQYAVDQYIRLVLKNGSLPTGNQVADLVEQSQ